MDIAQCAELTPSEIERRRQDVINREVQRAQEEHIKEERSLRLAKKNLKEARATIKQLVAKIEELEAAQ